MNETIVIEASFIVPIRPRMKIIRNGAVVIEGKHIADVGSVDEVKQRYKGDVVIKAHGSAVLPGFINAHTHLFQSILKSVAVDVDLLDWLRKVIHPTLTRFRDRDFHIAALWGIVDNIRSGVTTIIENHYGARGFELVAEALMKAKVRAVLARGIYEKNVLIEELMEDPEKALSHTERLVKAYHNKEEGMFQVAVAPMHPYNASRELLLGAKELSDKYGIIYHTHTAESLRDQEIVKRMHGKTDVRLMHDLGILSPKYHSVHSVWVSDEEVQMLAKSGAHVIHNPESNMYIGTGFAPIPKMMRAGINVALGTDGAGSNTNQDMIEAMRMAVLIHKAVEKNPSVITAWDVLEMATINGAKAIGMEDRLGSIEPGKLADIVVIDLTKPHTSPVYDPVGSIVYSSNASDVTTVIVNGNILMKDGKLIALDEERIRKEAYEVAERIYS